jgi:hypothetical protein
LKTFKKRVKPAKRSQWTITRRLKRREKLRQEKERIAERKRYIESGGLQSDVNEEMKRRMAEADIEDAEVIEVE